MPPPKKTPPKGPPPLVTKPAVTSGPGYPAIPALDHVARAAKPTFDEYLAGASGYIVNGRSLPDKNNATSKSAKSAQGDLSRALGSVIARELYDRHRKLILAELGPNAFVSTRNQKAAHVVTPVAPKETTVAGGLRTARSDVTEAHKLDGVRLAIEIKPTYRAVGRAIWNRFGDVRAFGVNIHLKFPFAVVGGVQVLPTWDFDENGNWVDTTASLRRAARRLDRIRMRETEADADHLLEAFLLIIFDPKTGKLDPTVPSKGSPLRWDGFIDALVRAYDTRFGAD
jgi:hypothetical protein